MSDIKRFGRRSPDCRKHGPINRLHGLLRERPLATRLVENALVTSLLTLLWWTTILRPFSDSLNLYFWIDLFFLWAGIIAFYMYHRGPGAMRHHRVTKRQSRLRTALFICSLTAVILVAMFSPPTSVAHPLLSPPWEYLVPALLLLCAAVAILGIMVADAGMSVWKLAVLVALNVFCIFVFAVVYTYGGFEDTSWDFSQAEQSGLDLMERISEEPSELWNLDTEQTHLVVLAYRDAYRQAESAEPEIGSLAYRLQRRLVDTHFPAAMYFSAVTWTTLGYGDFRPLPEWRAITACEAFMGYLFMVLSISYLTTWIRGNRNGRPSTLSRLTAAENDTASGAGDSH